MITVDEMLKAIVLSGRDEGYMDDGDDVSATNQIMVYFNGFDKTYDDKNEEIDDINNEIYDIYIHVDALIDDFEYPEPTEYLGIEFGHRGMVHIRAVYEVDKDYLHFNPIEEYADSKKGITATKLKKVLKAAYESVSNE